jgi:hypothetical protein
MLRFFHPSDRRRKLERDAIERLYRRGKRWTVWFWSLFWGGLMFFWMTVLDLFRHPVHLFTSREEVLWLLLSLLFWLAAGYTVGLTVWRSTEKKMQALSRTE